MKSVWLFALFSGLSYTLNSQEISNTDQDKPLDSVDNVYIIDHKKQLNVKLEVGNDISTYDLIDNDTELKIRPNLNLRYGVVLSYKFLSIRFGVRPKISDSQKAEKGDTDTFRLYVRMLFDNWNHVIQYNIEKGYYVMNTSDLVPSYNGIDIQFPDLESQVLMISSSYKFNKNYSMRAIQSQTEIQAKSAGSFMPGLGLNLYSLSGADRYRNENGEDIYRDSYNDYTGINVALNIGYYYTFVIKKQWFANGFAIPSVGIDFYGTRTHDSGSSEWRRYNEMYGALIYGFGGGYNGAKLFFGADFRNRLTSENFNTSKIRILPTQNQFSVYFGYRFRAPKPISKPVDLIEEKVPILKK